MESWKDGGGELWQRGKDACWDGEVVPGVGAQGGLTQIALMSDSWPVNVCRQVPSRTSQSLALASQAPEMKSLKSGDTARLMQSPVCPTNTVFCCPVSISHRVLQGGGEVVTRKARPELTPSPAPSVRPHHVVSPELVTMLLSSRKRQQER